MLDGWDIRVQERLLREVGARITNILDTTRETVQREVERGLADGLGAADLGDRIEASAGFDEYRSELIARTETATLLNLAAIGSYADYGVTHVTVIDGDSDDECIAANGQTWTLEQAEANPIGHPNCVRDFAPFFGTVEVPPVDRSAESDATALDKAGYEDRRGYRVSEDDGMVHLYHGTTGRNAGLIENSDGLRTEQGPGWYMLTTSYGQADRYAHGYDDGSGHRVLSYTLTPEQAKGLLGRGVLHTDDEFKQIVNGEPTDPLVHGLLHNVLPNEYLDK